MPKNERHEALRSKRLRAYVARILHVLPENIEAVAIVNDGLAVTMRPRASVVSVSVTLEAPPAQ